ncbi:hypothetical protein Vretimale_9960 [Volvox reticuliferus]|uniref:Uncharacterized protein n=1 Tax=Volvox reticuliferus TaxID=1737510 RepID=A0A8J4CYH6_9CHLO|nr:hypothetical protein Vretifemale_18836 [Volvox reticuliferus]GIM05515.1 hypothetical protein Vretimale_9960 [Volvox reticuliferus]
MHAGKCNRCFGFSPAVSSILLHDFDRASECLDIATCAHSASRPGPAAIELRSDCRSSTSNRSVAVSIISSAQRERARTVVRCRVRQFSSTGVKSAGPAPQRPEETGDRGTAQGLARSYDDGEAGDGERHSLLAQGSRIAARNFTWLIVLMHLTLQAVLPLLLLSTAATGAATVNSLMLPLPFTAMYGVLAVLYGIAGACKFVPDLQG